MLQQLIIFESMSDYTGTILFSNDATYIFMYECVIIIK